MLSADPTPLEIARLPYLTHLLIFMSRPYSLILQSLGVLLSDAGAVSPIGCMACSP
jgi:hypothetical protein